MSQENVEIVRQPLALKGRSSRGVEERLAVRFPRATALLAGAVWRLPQQSRLRQAFIRRALNVGWDAMNRGDFGSGLALYHEDVESIFDPGWIALGFRESRGLGERLRALNQFYAELELRFEPNELIDLGGDRLLTIGRMRGSGVGSGAPFDTEWANLVTISDGLVIRDQVFMSHHEALEAAGLSE
jgi:ketosteroid isomerase-like protein